MTPHNIILATIKSAATPEDAATAVLELVGAKKLVFHTPPAWLEVRAFNTKDAERNSYGYGTNLDGESWYRLPIYPSTTVYVATEAEAAAACQAHADAAHWAGTKLGGMLEGGNA